MIDLRTLVPLDVATILASVEKTSRLFTVEENPRLCGWGAEIASIVADEGFYSLDAPIVRITTPHVPLPSAPPRSRTRAIPTVDRIVDTVRATPRGRESDDRRASSGRAGWAVAMARALRARRARRPRPQPDPRAGRRARVRDSVRRSRRRRPRRRRARRRRRSRCSPTMTRSRDVYRGPDGLLEGARCRRRPRRHEHRHRRTRSARSRPTRGRRAPGILDAPVSGSVTLAESGQLTLMVGGDRRGPGAGAAGPRAAREDDRPRRPARLRRGDEARRQHRDLRPQRGRSRRGSSSPRPPASTERRLRRHRRRARSARRTSATSGRRSSSRTRRPSRSRSTSRRRTSA